MSLPSTKRMRFENPISKCMNKSTLLKSLTLSVALAAAGCSDSFEDGAMIEPSPDQRAELVGQDDAMTAFFKNKQNLKNVTNTSSKAKTIRRVARSS